MRGTEGVFFCVFRIAAYCGRGTAPKPVLDQGRGSQAWQAGGSAADSAGLSGFLRGGSPGPACPSRIAPQCAAMRPLSHRYTRPWAGIGRDRRIHEGRSRGFGRCPGSRGAVVVSDGSCSGVRRSADGRVGENGHWRRLCWRRQCAAFSRKLPAVTDAVVSSPTSSVRSRSGRSCRRDRWHRSAGLRSAMTAVAADGGRAPARRRRHARDRNSITFVEDGRHERQRVRRPMAAERSNTARSRARRAASAMRTLPQHRVRPEESGGAAARRRRRARDRHTFNSVKAVVTVCVGDSGRGDRRSRSIALPRIADANVEQGFRIVGRFPVPALPWSSARNRLREPLVTIGASVSEHDGQRGRMAEHGASRWHRMSLPP